MAFYSQYNQDEFIRYNIFEKYLDQPGFFIEVGADDGVRFSNSLHYERELKWKGICIEPRPSIEVELKNNRECDIIISAISDEEGSIEFLDIVGYGRQLSGIVKNYDNKHVDRIEREKNDKNFVSKTLVKVDVRPLSRVVEEYGVSRINLLSIDTEGSEVGVLKSIDFKRVFVDVILVENNYDHDYLALVPGFSQEFVLYDRIYHDEVYVNKKIAALI